MNKHKGLMQTVAAVALTVGFSLPAAALSVDFTKAADASSGNGYGNSLTFGSMTARAYADTGYYGKLETAQLLQWNTGLGVCNRDERKNCGSPQHQVDNSHSKDLVAFFFDSAVNFDSVTIDPYGKFDRDISYWVGSVGTDFNLSGNTYSSLEAVGFGSRTDAHSTVSNHALTVGLSGTGNALLVSASIAGGYTGNDFFKISGLNISAVTGPDTPTPVPLPAAAWLMMSGLAAYGWTARKRKAATAA
ncbi:VPLPA-CTERM sorting domain-containing protein [Allohahella marinimesophila]|uniref:Secreted protein n=1 Tax=Allohahella marinimesophila TaxID=1054972 RepID=A0ABP7NIX5_9GAMM